MQLVKEQDVKSAYIFTKRATAGALYTALGFAGLVLAPATGGLSLLPAALIIPSACGRYGDVIGAVAGDIDEELAKNPNLRGTVLEADLKYDLLTQSTMPELNAIGSGAWTAFKQVPLKIVSHTALTFATIYDLVNAAKQGQGKITFSKTDKIKGHLTDAGLISPTMETRQRLSKSKAMRLTQ